MQERYLPTELAQPVDQELWGQVPLWKVYNKLLVVPCKAHKHLNS